MIISHKQEGSNQHADYANKTDCWDAAFVTDRGGKLENQDCFGFVESHDGSAIFCIADGLGGHAGGRVASKLAVEAVCQFVSTDQYQFYKPQTLLNAFNFAHHTIIKKQQKDPKLSNMRTTLVVLCIKDNLAFWSHVGDVRLYHFRDNHIKFQTRDHSVPQMLADAGEITTDEIRHHTDRNKLLNSLGSKSCKPSIPLQYTQLEKGDFFHLSTDGFWEWITEKEMQSFFMNSRRKEQPMSHVLALMEMHVRRLASGEQPDNDNYSGFNLHITEAKKNTFQWKKTIFLKR